MIGMFLSHDEVVLLIEILQQKYNLKQRPKTEKEQETLQQTSSPGRITTPPKTKSEEKTLPLEVVYSDGTQSNKILCKKAIGVIIPGMRKLLYLDGSENSGTRSQARSYISLLPQGYNWHLMRTTEALAIQNHLGNVNYTLEQIKGLPISNYNYMLEDDGQFQGYVRYVADL